MTDKQLCRAIKDIRASYELLEFKIVPKGVSKKELLAADIKIEELFPRYTVLLKLAEERGLLR